MQTIEVIYLIAFVFIIFIINKLLPKESNPNLHLFIYMSQFVLFGVLFRKTIIRSINSTNYLLALMLLVFFGYLLVKIISLSRNLLNTNNEEMS